MLVIGIDPGTAITGYGLVQEEHDGKLTVIDYGVIKTPAKMAMPKRLLHIYRELKEIVLLHRPDSGAVEKLFFQKNVRTAISVGQGRGVAILALAEVDMPVFEYSPSEIKSSISGYGDADKVQMQYMIKAILEIDEIPKPDDAADALAVAVCHIHKARINHLSQNMKDGAS
jgi:crossover junction endodeoxyribonuclease RuvC